MGAPTKLSQACLASLYAFSFRPFSAQVEDPFGNFSWFLPVITEKLDGNLDNA